MGFSSLLSRFEAVWTWYSQDESQEDQDVEQEDVADGEKEDKEEDQKATDGACRVKRHHSCH